MRGLRWIGFPIRLLMIIPFIVGGTVLGILFWPDDIGGMNKDLWRRVALLEKEENDEQR